MRVYEIINEGWKESEQVDGGQSEGWVGVENTPDGVLILGEDIPFSDARAWVTFVYNITIDQIVSTKVYHGYNGEFDWDQDDVKDAIQEIVAHVKQHYGTTWDEIDDELHGGLSVDETAKYPFAGAKKGQKAGPAGQLKGTDPKGYPRGKLVGG